MFVTDAKNTQKAEHCPLALAESFLLENLSNPIAATDIAETAGVNVRALQRLFSTTYAATTTQVLLQKRIVLAREMILNGEALSVRRVAARLQFSKLARFSKLYRRFLSRTPSQEIRQGRANASAPAETNQ